MSKRDRWCLALAMTLAAAGVVWACGPDFPNQLLSDRAATLRHVPANPFAFEAARLVAADDALRAHEGWTEEDSARRVAAGHAGLDAAQIQQLNDLADLTAEQVLQRGAGLPAAVRLYAAGAADFRAARACTAGSTGASDDEGGMDAEPAHDSEDGEEEDMPASTMATPKGDCALAPLQLAQAATHFQAVLDLPTDQRGSRAVAAAYMLGRIHWLQLLDCRVCNAAELTAAAQRQFAAARELARQGAADPQGLAVASYGEEARLYLRTDSAAAGGSAAARHCQSGDFLEGTACPGMIDPADYRRAIGLYAEQAARDSSSGINSLRLLAGYALDHPPLSRALVVDPVSRQLLVAYALAMGADGASAEARLEVLTGAMQQKDVGAVAGVDRLASLAYNVGRYDLAASLAAPGSSPLASWVNAKLALHRGDLVAADAAYVQAIKGFPTDGAKESSLDTDNRSLLKGEHGVLALARGDYVAAMTRLYDASAGAGAEASYENDVQYLAERVLSVDELKTFVDARVPTPSPTNYELPDSYAPLLAGNLRWLLARRLMREGRYEAAQAYFPRSDDSRFGSNDLPKLARDYAAALDRSTKAWSAIGRAEGWYQAAVLARTHGMELLGYAQAPDYQSVEGNYDWGAGPDAKTLAGPYVTAEERSRYAQTAAKPDRRLHYRYIAADQASHAADLLPPRSQAFVAVLCQATGWMMAGPPDRHDHYPEYGEPEPTALPERLQRADALYRRYVEQGPYVSWAVDFGQHCEAPDFDRARSLLREQRVAQVRQFVRHYRGYAIGAFAVLVAGFGGWLWRRRKIKPAT